MNKHLVIIFAYHFPPENAIGGARPYRFAKYLAKLGNNCRVFTAAHQSSSGDSNTEYVPDPFVARYRSFGWHIERIIRKVFLPGAVGVEWSRDASRAARAYIKANPSASVSIFSTFPPLGSHLAAWQLARRTGYRWIADFRDPMRNEVLSDPVNPFQKKVDRWLENVLVRKADAVVVNTDGALIRWRRKFPSMDAKVHLIWNGFDPEERVRSLPVSAGACRVLSHTGELYGGRNATPILESIARLIAKGRISSNGVYVRLIGKAAAGTLPNEEFLNRARSEGWLELVNRQIDHKDALEISRSSDGLLLLQPQSGTEVPGKLFEYLQIGRPILAYIQPASPVERLLEQSGVPYRCVYPGSRSDVMDDILVEFFGLPSTPVATSLWFEEHFNAARQTDMLADIIRSLHEGPEHAVGAERSAANHSLTVTERASDSTIDLIDPI